MESKLSPSEVLVVRMDSADSPSGLNLDNLYKLIFHHKGNLSESSPNSVGLSEIFNVH